MFIVNLASATEYEVGVKVGDWMKYGNFVGVGPGTEVINQSDWSKIEVVAVSGTNVTFLRSGKFKNGSDFQEEGIAIDVEKGAMNGTVVGPSIVIAANLQEGDILPGQPIQGAPPFTINRTETRNYLGISRSVNILNVTQSVLGVDYQSVMIWDRVSGMLLEMSLMTEPYVMKMSYNVIDTNIFAPYKGPIYIRADGSIDPPTAPISTTDNITYSFTDNINSDSDGIVVERSKIIIDGNRYLLQGNGIGYGFTLVDMNNVTIKDTRITNFSRGIEIDGGATFLFVGNNIVVNNTIVHNYIGIRVANCWNNTVQNNAIVSNQRGINVFHSRTSDDAKGNHILDNVILDNVWNGIELVEDSDFTVIIGNAIENSQQGFYLENNVGGCLLYHNNIINNALQINHDITEANAWDDGVEGNHWSNYTGVDLNPHDGIGDTSHIIDANNIDHYPLTGPFRSFDAGTWNNTTYYVDVSSNSNVTNFTFNPYSNPPTLSFDVEGGSGTSGFCRVAIPKALMWCGNKDEWTITVGGTLTSATNITETTDYTYIYFTYTHSTKPVQIQSTYAVPEHVQSVLLIALAATIAIFSTIKKSKKLETKHN